VHWELTGKHNRSNALAAIAAARHVGVPPGQAIDSLARFQSVKRRMEVRGVVNGITVYDDFAHHPTAIATTVGGLRQKSAGDGGRILAVLEPRSNTMKLGAMKDALPGSLKDADLVFGFGSQQALGWSLADALKPLGEDRPQLRPARLSGAGHRAGGPAGRPHPGDEQRRLRRRAPETAGGAGGAQGMSIANDGAGFIPARLPLLAALLQGARGAGAHGARRPRRRPDLPATAGFAEGGDGTGAGTGRAPWRHLPSSAPRWAASTRPGWPSVSAAARC
jgi:hypothetical protein